jgi:hypothetical protein
MGNFNVYLARAHMIMSFKNTKNFNTRQYLEIIKSGKGASIINLTRLFHF